MIMKIKSESRERRIIEQSLSLSSDIYATEDDRFLYYCVDDIFHVVKGNLDLFMDIDGWEAFAKEMLSVSDEYFVTGEGRQLKQQMGFIGGYISKYSRRQEFANGLLDVIEDARVWN